MDKKEIDIVKDDNEILDSQKKKSNKKIVIAIVAVLVAVAIGVGVYFAITSSSKSEEEETTTQTTTGYEDNFKQSTITRQDAAKKVKEIKPKTIGLKSKSWDDYSVLSSDEPVLVDNEQYFKFVVVDKIGQDGFNEDNILVTVFYGFDGKTVYYAKGSVSTSSTEHEDVNVDSKDLTKLDA